MITRPVVIPGYRKIVNFIITRFELKSDSFDEILFDFLEVVSKPQIMF